MEDAACKCESNPRCEAFIEKFASESDDSFTDMDKHLMRIAWAEATKEQSAPFNEEAGKLRAKTYATNNDGTWTKLYRAYLHGQRDYHNLKMETHADTHGAGI